MTHVVALLALDVVHVPAARGGHLGVVVARVQVGGGARAQRHLFAEARVLALEPLHWVLQPGGRQVVYGR